MKSSQIKSIKIEGRGRNRDIYGNPYYAWKAVIDRKANHHMTPIVIYEKMSWGTSSQDVVLREAVEGINEALDINLKQNDKRITYTYTHVSGDAPLRNPLNWK